MTIANLEGALCVGQWWLFDSVDLRDHQEAREICDTCPVLTACAGLTNEVLIAGKTLSSHGGGPTGTWAGDLFGVSGRTRRGRRNPREHGTDRGYHQHRTANDATCDPCREAHAQMWHKRKAIAS